MTRALVVGPIADWSTADVARGWAEGLAEIGCRSRFYSLSDRVLWYRSVSIPGHGRLDGDESREAASVNLLAEVYRFDPDVVFIVHGAHVWPPVIAEIRCPVVMVMTECPYENEAQAITAAQCAPQMILVNDPEGAAPFAGIAPTYYSPHAYRPSVHTPHGPAMPSDVVFVGTGYPERVAMLEGVDWSGIDLALAGMWETLTDDSPLMPYVVAADCIDNDQTAVWYRGTKVALNIYRTGAHGEHSLDDGWAIGPREVELAACGTFFLRSPRGESDELLGFLPSFTCADELAELVREWLPRDTERAVLAARARDAVADRTFATNAARALARLGV